MLKPTHEIYDECLRKTLEIIRLLTKESEDTQWEKFITDPLYNTIIKHIAQMYYTLETDDCIKEKGERFAIQYKLIIENLTKDLEL